MSRPFQKTILALAFAAAVPALAATTHEYRRAAPNLKVSSSTTTPAPTPSNPTPSPTLNAELSTASLSFSGVAVGSHEDKQVALLNIGTGALSISSVDVSGSSAFSASTSCGPSLASQDQCVTLVRFTPQTRGTVTGKLSLVTNASQGTLEVPLSGTGLTAQASLAAAPSSDFGSVALGSTASRSVTFTNTGDYALTGVYGRLTGEGLSLASSNCGTQAAPVTIAVGGSCSAVVHYTPSAAVALSGGKFDVAFNPGNQLLSNAFSGQGAASTISVTPNPLNFVGQTVGTTGTRALTVTNTGSALLTLQPAQIVTGQSDFAIANPQVSNPKCGSTLAAGQSCAIDIAFTPSTRDARTGTVRVLSNASNTVPDIDLSGSGLVYVGTLAANTSPDFGTVNVGQTVTRSFTFTNTGNTVLSGIYAQLAGTSMSLQSNTCGTQASPVSFGPGNTCSVTVQYQPAAAGTVTDGLLRVFSSATASPSSVTLQAQAVNTDPNAANVAAFMNMDGTVGSAITASADATGKLVTSRGSPAVYSSTAVFGQSALFATSSTGGGGTCGVIPTTSLEVARSAAFEFDTTDFTMELRARPSGLGGNQGLLSFYESCTGGGGNIKGWVLYLSGTKVIFNRGNGADQPFTFATNLANNTFYHLALVKTGSTVSLYVNGVKDANVMTLSGTYLPTNSNNGTSVTNLRVGSIHTVSAGGFMGNLDEIRVTRGVARYTGNFTPNTQALTYP